MATGGNNSPKFRRWIGNIEINGHTWRPRNAAENAVATAIGLGAAGLGIVIGLLALFGVGLPAVGIALAIALGVVALVVAVVLGALLLPVAILLAPLGFILWLIFR